MITKIKLFFKKFWRTAVGMVGIAAVSAAGTTALIGEPVVIQGDTLTELQSRLQGTGIELYMQAKVNKQTETGLKYNTAIYLTQEQVDSAIKEKGYDGVASDIAIQGEKLFTDWKTLVETKSRTEAPVEELTPVDEQIQ